MQSARSNVDTGPVLMLELMQTDLATFARSQAFERHHVLRCFLFKTTFSHFFLSSTSDGFFFPPSSSRPAPLGSHFEVFRLHCFFFNVCVCIKIATPRDVCIFFFRLMLTLVEFSGILLRDWTICIKMM